MPTEIVYKNQLKVIKELVDMGLDGWTTEMTITDKKKKTSTNVKVIIKLKEKKFVKQKHGE